MLKTFLYPLREYFTPFNIFQYITFRGAYAAITSLLITFLLGPYIVKQLKKAKIGDLIREDGPQTHFSKSGTPTMGGLLILTSASISVLLWQDITSIYTLISLVSIIGFGAIGFLDDYIKTFKKDKNGLKSKYKIIGQLLVGGIIIFLTYLAKGQDTSYIYFPMSKSLFWDIGIFYAVFAMFLLVGMSNAVNLTDGLDGLATGLSIFVFVTFAILAYVSGRIDYSKYLFIPFVKGAGELTILSLALTGSCVGFLWYNSHPAEVIMGDTGALALGGTMATLSLLIKKELLMIIICGVFVIETLSVMIQVSYYKLTKKRVFLMSPLHHHFEKLGWHENKIVTRFWILGGLFAIISLSTLKLR